MKPNYRERDAAIPQGYTQQPLVAPSSSSQHHHHHTIPPHHHHIHHSQQPHQQQQQPSLQQQHSSTSNNSHHHHHPRATASTNNNFSGGNNSSTGGFKHEGSLVGPGNNNNNYPGEFSAFGSNNGGGGSSQPYGGSYSQYSNSNQQQEANRMELQQQQQLLQQQQHQQQQLALQQQQPHSHLQPHQRGTTTTSNHNQPIAPVVPRIPLADRDIFMLSLPSQDLPHYYDPESSSDSEAPSSSLTTNRGHKLLPSSRHVRRGRLGSYPHTDLGFEPTSVAKRQKTMSGTSLGVREGFSIAPNFHLLKSDISRSSDIKLLATLPPPPQTPLDLLLSSSLQHTLGAKNQTFKTLSMSTTGLIEQEGELIGSLQRVCSKVRGEGFEWRWPGDEERMKVRMEEREKEREIEEERERVEDVERAKKEREIMEENERRRVVEAKNAEILAEKERIEQERLDELERIEQVRREKAIFEGEKLQRQLEEVHAKEELARQMAIESATAPVEVVVVEEQVVDAEVSLPNSIPTEANDAMDTTGDNEEFTSPSAALPSLLPVLPSLPTIPSTDEVPITDSSLEIDPALLPPLPTASTSTSNDDVDMSTLPAIPTINLDTEMNSALEKSGESSEIKSAVEEGGEVDTSALTVPLTNEEEVIAAETLAEGGVEGGEGEDSPEEPTIRRRSGRVASRIPGESNGATGSNGFLSADMAREGSTESSGSDAPVPLATSINGVHDSILGSNSNGIAGCSGVQGESLGGPSSSLLTSASTNPNRRKRIAEEEMPEYAKRLVDPEIYVRSLFVSDESVEMPMNGPPGGGGGGGTGVDLLSPNEQEVMVHDCLTDLHRFLADSLEYRSRLSEIRDGVLGVERRRKGLWKVVRMVAADWLEEESNAQENE